MKRYTSKKQGYVIVNGEYVPVKQVKFLDIEEDIQGIDVMTFEYKGETRKSYVVIR
jgi:hypothetical protein